MDQLMFILRGLPGSGKSTLAKEIQYRFKTTDCVALSADDFRYSDKGDYVWSKENEVKARMSCFEKAAKCCEDSVAIIIIDNTNRRFEDIKCYLDLAFRASYVTVIIEPTTAWKDNIEELACRNKHGVDMNTLKKMETEYEVITPHFYGWFLPRKASSELLEMCNEVFADICNCERFFDDIINKRKDVTHVLLRAFHTTCGNSTQRDMLHVTSFYLNSKTSQKTIAYYNHILVTKQLGKSTVLHLIGLCFTENTVFALIKLTDDQMSVLSDGPTPHLAMQGYSHVTIGHTDNTDSVQCKKDQELFVATLFENDVFTTDTKFGKLNRISKCKWRLDFYEEYLLPAIYSAHYCSK